MRCLRCMPHSSASSRSTEQRREGTSTCGWSRWTARGLVTTGQGLGGKAGRQDSQALRPDRPLPAGQQHEWLLEATPTGHLLATNGQPGAWQLPHLPWQVLPVQLLDAPVLDWGSADALLGWRRVGCIAFRRARPGLGCRLGLPTR